MAVIWNILTRMKSPFPPIYAQIDTVVPFHREPGHVPIALILEIW